MKIEKPNMMMSNADNNNYNNNSKTKCYIYGEGDLDGVTFIGNPNGWNNGYSPYSGGGSKIVAAEHAVNDVPLNLPLPTVSHNLPTISIPIEKVTILDQYKICLEWYFLFKEYSVFLASESIIVSHLETARQFFKNVSFDFEKNQISSQDISYDDMSDIMLHLDMFAAERRAHIENDALKHDKKYWLNELNTHKIPTTGRLCDHIIQNGNSVIERQTKKMITLYGKKTVSSWWDEYRGELIDF
ncbi:MAG: hypothetical protein WD512_17705 [Candidatus Paceibacterota bacterium]